MEFKHFKAAIATQFTRLQGYQPFRITTGADEDGNDTTKDVLWDTYLAGFPEGTNPVFRKQREYDCSCCRQFIRAVGNVVAIVDGKLESIWDIDPKGLEEPFLVVAHAMSTLVKASPIANEFLHYEQSAGTNNSRELVEGKVTTWNHFYVTIKREFVLKGDELAAAMSVSRSSKDVFLRSLEEIDSEGVEAVLDLISQNSLYRGEQFKRQVARFAELQTKFKKLTSNRQRELFAWTFAKKEDHAVTHIRNTAIGTLLVDLSDTLELEDAVRKFEVSTMAPSNYKRPTALVSKAQIEKAKEKIRELGLEGALERRYATMDDITIKNVLFADRKIKKMMSGNALDDLLEPTAASKAINFDKIEEVGIDKFLADVLPRAHHLDLWLDNAHASRMVSLVTAVDPTSNPLFQWSNPFSWDYAGNVADSIKERVKAAGGAVTGDLMCRLAWDYADDLDFHMVEPTGYTIYYGNRRVVSPNGGMLDVDANGIDGIRPDPVENIVYASKREMREGDYQLQVHNFTRRSDGTGFTVEIEHASGKTVLTYPKVIRSGEKFAVANINYSKAKGFSVVADKVMESSSMAKEFWGLKANQFVPVTMLMNSPNYWDGQVGLGNKHWFFMLHGATNDGKPRPFYNEYLSPELNEHRKVLELIGGKIPVQDVDSQLSGVGISSTQKESVVVRVRGSVTRTLRVVF